MDLEIERLRSLFGEAREERLELLDALFRREREVVGDAAVHVLGAQAIDDLRASGLMRDTRHGFAAQVRVVQFRGQLIASDRLGFRRHAEFVMGPGPASALLADAIRPPAQGRILDLGCGPGTQGLWLASDDIEVLGLDISARALAFAAFNQRFNARTGTTFVHGDFLTAPPDPALDERFDLAFANPPFVLAPVTELLYRDRPLPGNGATQTAVERIARALAPGGRGYVLGTWFDAGTGPWDSVPRAWLGGLGVRGAIARVSSTTPSGYAALWNRDLDEPGRSKAIEAWSRGSRPRAQAASPPESWALPDLPRAGGSDPTQSSHLTVAGRPGRHSSERSPADVESRSANVAPGKRWYACPSASRVPLI